jgi:plastocyanin
MHHRFWRRAIVATLVLALAVLGGTAAIAKAPKKAPKKTTIEMKGKTTVKRNKFIKDAVHFSPGKASIRSGGTLTLKNRSAEPHTFSIVKQSDVPKTPGKIFDCGSPGTVCDTIFTALAPDPQGNPTKSVVDVGAAGIDQVGDTIVVDPKKTQKVNVSASKGTTLHFICAFHAWMQGQLRVR